MLRVTGYVTSAQYAAAMATMTLLTQFNLQPVSLLDIPWSRWSVFAPLGRKRAAQPQSVAGWLRSTLAKDMKPLKLRHFVVPESREAPLSSSTRIDP
jgi:hypothetical protein